ncbi:MAG: hypothetical protein P8Y45_06585 [Exilibacterium sp.]
MANDKDWQRRSDEWVKSMHESRLRKERSAAKRNEQKENKHSSKDAQKNSEKNSGKRK